MNIRVTYQLAQMLADGIEDEPSPEHSRAALSSTLGILCLLIKEDTWERLMEISGEPCGTPMCDCHLLGEELFKALNKVRIESSRIKDLAKRGIEP